MAARRLSYRVETKHLSAPFRISGFVFETSDVLVAKLTDGEFTGRGEAAGVYYLGDDSAHMVEEIEAHRNVIEGCASRAELRELMPSGGARNAVDCALWDLEAKQQGTDARTIARLDDTKDFPMRKVARATSAAPTYFEPLKLDASPPADYFAPRSRTFIFRNQISS